VEAQKAILERVEELAQKKDVPMSAISTAWVLHKGARPILGLGSKQRIDDAVLALKVKLTEDEIKYLEEPYLPRAVTGY
jgi:aryl-alcohol dehydrogenase-like predicted oxidoreductase